MLLAGVIIAGFLGDYAAHAIGWHAQSLDVTATDDQSP
jgi:hypothetical protein